MGSSTIIATAGGGGAGGSGDVRLWCWCRWRCCEHHQHHRAFSSGLVFFLGCFLVFASIGWLYAWLVFTPPYAVSGLSSLGCQEDSEGSWSIGVFYGHAPFALKPIETMNVWRDQSAAWPVANPVITCASVTDAGFPSNFVADPFLFMQGKTLFMFYETKNSITMQGDIGVARSTDGGATWQQLGIALDEDWHLSFPYVFENLGNIYMMPESSEKGEVRIYGAVDFPLQWKLEKVIIKKPLIDSVIINHDGRYWLFGSDHSSFGSKKNGQLEIWYSDDSPLGPWKPHKKNPVYNTDKSVGARNGGRPFVYSGKLYRVGQDCGETYGRRVRLFRVEILTKDDDFKEVEVPLGVLEEPTTTKGRNAWNGARYHHLDVQRLDTGEWIGIMDGDRVPSGDSVHRFVVGCACVAGVAAVVVLMGVVVGAVKCIIPLNWCTYGGSSKRASSSSTVWERSTVFSSKVRRFCSRLNCVSPCLRNWVRINTCIGKFIFALIFAIGVALMCTGFKNIYGGDGAEEAYQWKGHYSEFTLLTMTYDARLWNLKMYIKHYSRCSSVKEIVVVWNKGVPPEPSDFDSAVPVRIRVEPKNSLNNRFKIDPLIKTKAVLELDDDIMMTCDDVERGFSVWRQHPDRIVGFYPRLAGGSPLKYRAEKHARAHNAYNMILTGAAFLDSKLAFQMYWGSKVEPGRALVDNYFNCEDVLMNYLYANATSTSSTRRTVEYVKPAWAIDTSKFSSAAISKNTNVHYRKRTDCLIKFAHMYGSLEELKYEFNGRKDGWDV